MRAALFALPFAAALGFSAVSVAAEPWELDKSHATIKFQVSHLGFSTTTGVFREFDAEVDFDPENIEATKATFTIDAASVDTFWEARDTHIRSEDFLNVEEYPTITFALTDVSIVDETTATVVGDVTIAGVTKPVTFDAVLNRIGEHPFQPGKKLAGFTVTGEIDRTEFGVDTFAPAIGAVMPVEISFEISPAG